MVNFVPADYPLILWYIGVLTFLEGLLSADNALVLALMVRHLPKREQRRVLFYGIWGAVGFRVVAVLLSAILLRFWIFKAIGGLYLLYLAVSHFFSRGDHSTEAAGAEATSAGTRRRRWLHGFWGTVTSVTMADIAFSIDSILAAVAMADGFPKRFGDDGKVFIVVVGGILGIITMRFVVRYFLILLDRFPGLAEGAYWLVAWIGLKLVISGLHDAGALGFHVPEVLFWSVMLVIAVVSLIVKPGGPPPDISGSLDLLDAEEEPRTEGPDHSEDEPLRDGPGGGTGDLDGLDRPSSDQGQQGSAEQTRSGLTL